MLLVDFNPFSTMTDGLLFSWDELMKMRCDHEVKKEVREK